MYLQHLNEEKRMTKNKLKKILIVSDAHHPFVDKKAWQLLLNVGKDQKPDAILIQGDFADFYSVSSHSKDANRLNSFEDEVAAVNKALDELDALGAKEKHFVAGNHEDRLQRYLNDKAPELNSFVTIPQLFNLKKRGWKYTPYKQSVQIGKLNATHDVGSAGKNAIFQALSTFQHNVVQGHCLPWDYKVITPSGPIPFEELKINDDVLTYKNGKVEVSKVLEKVKYKYTGDLATFDNNRIRMSMTSKHHIYTKDDRYVPLSEALQTLTKADLVHYAEPLDNKEFDIQDDMLRLVVAYAADGSVAFSKPNGVTPCIRFHLKKERKIERLTKLVTSLGYNIDFTYSSNGKAKSRNISKELRTQLHELVPNKWLPQWLLKLSARQRQIVIDELVLWDGSILIHEDIDYGCRQFASSKKQEIDLVTTLLTQHGIKSKQVKKGMVVTFNVGDKDSDNHKKLKEFVEWEKVENMDVGCITTNNQNFFVMTEHGNIELSGNTHRIAFFVEGNAKGEAHVGASFGWLGDKKSVDYMHAVKVNRDWAHGFGFANMEPNGNVHIQPIVIVDYKCVVNGKLYKV
jgi:predicted phosphodiesterase